MDLVVEEVERDQRLKICACHSLGHYLEEPSSFDDEVLKASYICPPCQLLIDEIERARVDYVARVNAAIDDHAQLHATLRPTVEADEERIWADKTTPQSLDELLAEWDAEMRPKPLRPPSWAARKNPELAFIDQASEKEKEIYRREAGRRLLHEIFPWISEIEWRSILA